MLAAPVGIPGGAAGGVIGGVGIARDRFENLPLNGRDDRGFQGAQEQQCGACQGRFGMRRPRTCAPIFPKRCISIPRSSLTSDGRASIVIPMADSITTWRMAMIASTQHGALGTSTSSLKVFQDFFVDLDLPVTLTQGDRVSIPVAIYNYSDSPGEVNLQLQPDDWFSLVADTGEKSVAVEAAASEARNSPSKPNASENSS